MADYERVGNALRGAMLSAAIFETPGMPWPTPKELGELGFSHVSYPASLIFRITADHERCARATARTRRRQCGDDPGSSCRRCAQLLDQALNLADWQRIEHDFATTSASTVAAGRAS